MMNRACSRELLPDTELLESGIMDSLALIILAEELEDAGITASVARIPHSAFSSVHTLYLWFSEYDREGN